MPETAIHKYNDTLAAKGEIRFPKMALATTPAADAMRPEVPRQRQLRVLVSAAPDAGHHLGPFRFGEDVRHFIL
jgi:hypothetical protein